MVTGIGAVTPIGLGADGLWNGVLEAKSAVRRITQFDASALPAQIAAEVDGFDFGLWIGRIADCGLLNADANANFRMLRRLDRCSQFAVVSASMAAADASLRLEDEDRSRIGVCIGSALGGAAYAEEQHRRFLAAAAVDSRQAAIGSGSGHRPAASLRSVDPHLALQMFVGAGTCCTAIALGVTGYSTSNADSCASGTIAISNGFRAIQRGDADVILAGGAEAPLAPLCYGSFALIRALSTRNDEPERACRPFDKDRDGFVMGEGAAVLVLEEREHAIGRGARIYAEILGSSITNDGHHMTAPRPDGESAARAISLALQESGVESRESGVESRESGRGTTPTLRLDYINAHGSSTLLNDSTETVAIKRVFGDAAYGIPISGTKGMHGHALGASGAIEAAICCLALENGTIPPTVNLDEADPACDLDYVPCDANGLGRRADLKVVLSNSFGFGGINACLVFHKGEL